MERHIARRRFVATKNNLPMRAVQNKSRNCKTMKTKLLTMIFASFLFLGTTHADLIDLTPGGFSFANEPPAFVAFLQEWIHGQTVLIAGANIDGNTVTWSPFTMFGPPNFSIDLQQPNANVSWNLTDTAGYFTRYIWVDGSGDSNQITDNLYAVTGDFRFDGEGLVTIDGINPITSIAFFGNNVPDEANTGALFVLAIGALLLAYEAQRRRNA